MNGIAGGCGELWRFAPENMLERLLASMERRGQNGSGAWKLNVSSNHVVPATTLDDDTNVFLAQRWLHSGSTTNRSNSAISDDGRFALALDGSVLNIPELRAQIESTGARLRTQTDEEVLLAGFCMHGIRYVSQFTGLFAIALLDTLERRLYLARDEFGVKTVYYHSTESGICFSSDLPTILQWPHIPRRVHATNLFAFLRHASTNQEGSTLFAEIRQLLPGSYMTIDIDRPMRFEIEAYRDQKLPDVIDVSFNEATARVRDLFLESVGLNMRSSKPVGASLSGGTDSTAIVMAMRHIGESETPLNTFSYVAPGVENVDEEQWIDFVNGRADAIPHKVSATSEDFVRDIASATRAAGEPLGGTSQYVQRRVYGLVRDSAISAVLDGIGGDGVTAGHAYYPVDRLYELIRTRRYYAAAKMLIALLRRPETRNSRMMVVQALAYLPTSIQKFIRTQVNQELFPSWLDECWFRARGANPDLPQALKGARPLHRHMATTVRSDRLSRYAERAAATSGGESRLPFLYRPLVDLLLSLPSGYLVSQDGQGRQVFRTAMRGIVPDEILDRRNKIGFLAPENQWMAEREAWVASTLNDGIQMGVPIRISGMTDGLPPQRPALSSLVRTLTVIEWAKAFRVEFD